jgi:hypothetical protein
MYKIVVSLTAQDELEAAEFFYYFKISEKVSDKFIVSVLEPYIRINPLILIIQLKIIGTISKFPYLLFL